MRFQNVTSIQEGPILTNYSGELDIAVEICSGCKHLGIHDCHYYYCAAQPVTKQEFPWPGAGIRLPSHHPNAACPHPLTSKEVKA